MSDLDLLRQARDELRIWLRQLHGMAPRDATQDAMRLDPLIVALDVRLRQNPYRCEPDCTSPRCPAKLWEQHQQFGCNNAFVPPGPYKEKDCGGASASWTYCCEKHAEGHGSDETLIREADERAVLDAMTKVEIVEIVGGPAYIAHGQANTDAAAAELKRRRRS